jgi:hypothetical protein
MRQIRKMTNTFSMRGHQQIQIVCDGRGDNFCRLTWYTIIVMLFSLTISVCLAASRSAIAQQQHKVSVSPSEISPGQSITLIVSSSTGLDLRQIGVAQVTIFPDDGISNLQAIPQPGNELRIDFTLDASASLGNRELIIAAPDNMTAVTTLYHCRDGKGMRERIVMLSARPDY